MGGQACGASTLLIDGSGRHEIVLLMRVRGSTACAQCTSGVHSSATCLCGAEPNISLCMPDETMQHLLELGLQSSNRGGACNGSLPPSSLGSATNSAFVVLLVRQIIESRKHPCLLTHLALSFLGRHRVNETSQATISPS